MTEKTVTIDTSGLNTVRADEISHQTSVYVYELPVRIWHWVNAAAIVVLCITGYFIGAPPPSMQIGEAVNQFVFGYIRFAHFAAAMLLTVGFFGRLYWAFVGNRYSREIFLPPFWKKLFWEELLFELRWYLFLEKHPRKIVGHNPLAQVAMFFAITLGLLFMMVTGWALYAQGAGAGSYPDKAMGWVLGLIWNSQWLHTLHHLGMWVIILFMIAHIYLAIREDIMSRQSMVSTMISGHRTFKDDLPD